MNLEEEFNNKLTVIRSQYLYNNELETFKDKIIGELKKNLVLKIGEELLKNDLIDFEYEINSEHPNKVKAVFAFITKKDLKEIINKFKNKE